MDMKLELIALPVSDVDRVEAFYVEQFGFIPEHDHDMGDLRCVQLTPPGSACSIAIGRGIIDTEPGSVAGLGLVVASADEARAKLLAKDAQVSEIQEFAHHETDAVVRRSNMTMAGSRRSVLDRRPLAIQERSAIFARCSFRRALRLHPLRSPAMPSAERHQ